MSTSDVEIDELLVEAGRKLVDPPASVDELLALLDQVESCLAKVDQSPSKYMQEVLSVPLKALVGDRLFKHSNIDVRVAVAACMSEITRISAPEAPYEDDKMKEVFQLIVSSFENLYDKSARSYGKRCGILETAAKVRSCVLMLDLECDALILEMFHLFLKEIRDYHPESVFGAMETIMALVIEESEDISPELLFSVLETVKKDNEEVQPIVKKLGERVLESCASKLKPYLSQSLKSLGVCSNDYSSVVSLICEETVEGTEQNKNGVHRDDVQKLDEGTEELATPQQDDVSPESVISNGEVKEEQDSSLADSASVKKKEHGHDSNAAEKTTNLSSTDDIDKSDRKTESQQDQTLERKGSNPKSSTEQVESADSEEKEADSKETAEVQNQQKEVENDITTAASKNQSAEGSLKEAAVERSSSLADGKEPEKDASSPHSQEEDQEKKDVAEEKKVSMVKDVKGIAEEITEKKSEEKRSADEVVEKVNAGSEEKSSKADMDIDTTSGSAEKPLKQSSEEALRSKEASVEMGEDEVETPTVEGDKVSDEKPREADDAIDATSDSEAKSLKQLKKKASSPISGSEISTKQPKDKKEHVKTSAKKDADKVTSDEKSSKADKNIDANSDSEAKSAKQRKKEAVNSSSGAGISTRRPRDKKGQPEGRKDPEKQAKAFMKKGVDKVVNDEKPSQTEMDIDATSDSEAKPLKQLKKEASNSRTRQPEDKKEYVKGRIVSGKQVKTSAKKDVDKVIPDEKPSDADKDSDATSDTDTKSLKQHKEGLSSSSRIATRKPVDRKTQDKGRTVSGKLVKTSEKKDVDKVISDEKPSKVNKDIHSTSDSEAKSLKQRKKEPVSSNRQAEDKKGQAKGKMISEKQTKTSVKKDVDKVISDEKPSRDKDVDATSDSEEKPLRLRKKEASSSSGGISKRQPEDKKEQAKGKIVSEKQVKTSAKKDFDKDKEVVSSSKTGNKRARDETHIDHSKKRTPAKEEKSNKKEFGKELVGSRIKVWWPLDKAYYEGKVSSFDPVKKKHKVSYVDGDIETLQLKDEKWKLVTDDSESDQDEKSEDEESFGASPERSPMKKGRTNLNSSSGKKEKVEASSKKSGGARSSGKSKGATPISGGKNQSSKNGVKTAKSKESEVEKGSARSKQQEMPRTAKRKQEEEEEEDDDLPPTPKSSKTPEVAGKSNTNGSGKAKSASKTLGGTKSLPEKKKRRV